MQKQWLSKFFVALWILGSFGIAHLSGQESSAQESKQANFTSTGTKEYRLRKSKSIIDEIDRLICPLYDLSESETEFIINYEIEFRAD